MFWTGSESGYFVSENIEVTCTMRVGLLHMGFYDQYQSCAY